jgi:hypothetical protein
MDIFSCGRSAPKLLLLLSPLPAFSWMPCLSVTPTPIGAQPIPGPRFAGRLGHGGKCLMLLHARWLVTLIAPDAGRTPYSEPSVWMPAKSHAGIVRLTLTGSTAYRVCLYTEYSARNHRTHKVPEASRAQMTDYHA